MNESLIRIRRAVPSDLDIIVGFNRAMADETEGKSLDLATITAGVQNILADSSRGYYFVAEDLDRNASPKAAPPRLPRVVGQTMITYEWSDWRSGYFWWIQSVYVDPAHRRKGVFRALYDHIRTEARTHPDVCGLRLYVYHSNVQALQTYRDLGMSIADYKLCVEDWSAEPGAMD